MGDQANQHAEGPVGIGIGGRAAMALGGLEYIKEIPNHTECTSLPLLHPIHIEIKVEKTTASI